MLREQETFNRKRAGNAHRKYYQQAYRKLHHESLGKCETSRIHRQERFSKRGNWERSRNIEKQETLSNKNKKQAGTCENGKRRERSKSFLR